MYFILIMILILIEFNLILMHNLCHELQVLICKFSFYDTFCIKLL